MECGKSLWARKAIPTFPIALKEQRSATNNLVITHWHTGHQVGQELKGLKMSFRSFFKVISGEKDSSCPPLIVFMLFPLQDQFAITH